MAELVDSAVVYYYWTADSKDRFEQIITGTMPRKMYAERLMIEVMIGNIPWCDLKYLQGENDFAADILAASIEVGQNSDLKDRAMRTDGDAEGKPLWLRYMTAGSKGPRKMTA